MMTFRAPTLGWSTDARRRRNRTLLVATSRHRKGDSQPSMQHLEPRPTHINERPKLGTSLKLLNVRLWVYLTSTVIRCQAVER
jgi:hypothetical protein